MVRFGRIHKMWGFGIFRGFGQFHNCLIVVNFGEFGDCWIWRSVHSYRCEHLPTTTDHVHKYQVIYLLGKVGTIEIPELRNSPNSEVPQHRNLPDPEILVIEEISKNPDIPKSHNPRNPPSPRSTYPKIPISRKSWNPGVANSPNHPNHQIPETWNPVNPKILPNPRILRYCNTTIPISRNLVISPNPEIPKLGISNPPPPSSLPYPEIPEYSDSTLEMHFHRSLNPTTSTSQFRKSHKSSLKTLYVSRKLSQSISPFINHSVEKTIVQTINLLAIIYHQ